MSATIQANNPDVQWLPNASEWELDGWINCIAGVPFKTIDIESEKFTIESTEKDGKIFFTFHSNPGPGFNYLYPRPPSEASAEQAKSWAANIRSAFNEYRLAKLYHFASHLLSDELKKMDVALLGLKEYVETYATFLENCQGYQVLC